MIAARARQRRWQPGGWQALGEQCGVAVLIDEDDDGDDEQVVLDVGSRGCAGHGG